VVEAVVEEEQHVERQYHQMAKELGVEDYSKNMM
jgi:hypothetical protein